MDKTNVRVFAPYVYSQSSGHEWRAYCPVHEDPRRSKTPSASFNFIDGVWHCAGCGEGGSIEKLRRQIRKDDRYTGPHKFPYQTIVSIIDKSMADSGEDDEEMVLPLPAESKLQKWQADLMKNTYNLQKFMEKRGLTKRTIREHMIGWDGMRYTLPIRDADGKLVNVRRYKITRVAKNKMVNLPGHGDNVIVGLDIIEEHDRLVLCEGEFDWIMALQMGIPAFSHTGGANYWNGEWSKLFDGKVVYIAYDDDPQGEQGARKVAEALDGIAADVFRVKLDTGIKGGDLTDFFVKCGHTVADFWERVESASSIAVSVPTPDGSGTHVSMEESYSPEFANQTIEVDGVVIGSQTVPYVIPLQVTATCGMNAGAACKGCPLAGRSGSHTMKLDRMDPDLMKYANITNTTKRLIYKDLFGARCRKVEYTADEVQNLEVMYVRPVLTFETKEEARTPVVRTVYNLGSFSTRPNEQVNLVGKQSPSPDKQGNVLYTWKMESVSNELDNFEMTPAIYRRLKKFQPKPGVDPYTKCKRIANDLAKHTGIVDRTMMHVAMDLVWHSILSFHVDGMKLEKGWLEGMIIGDTRTGKSRAAEQLMRYYRMGTFIGCETTTYAGLVGGSDKVNDKNWVVKWGVIPQNDRRMVVLDEFSGMTERNIIERMSGIRSVGVAQISSISGDVATSARTRMLWITNPHHSNGMLKDSTKGMIPALNTLIPTPEDQARFDFVMGVAEGEVDPEKINTLRAETQPRLYGSDDCRLLLLWAWSRKSDDVEWDVKATEALYNAANRLGNEYVADPPLIQAANIREKLARVATAIAARTFSTNAKGNKLIVKSEHVHSAVWFLTDLYTSEYNGYAAHSSRIIEAEAEAKENMAVTRKMLKANHVIVEALASMDGQRFTIRDLEDAGLDRSEATDLTRHLIRLKMVTRRGRFFHTSRHMNSVIKGLSHE